MSEHFNIPISIGDYDVLRTKIKKYSGLNGNFFDKHGQLTYRFHGTGCELTSFNFNIDFNIYPKIDGKSHILISPFKFMKFLHSQNIIIDDKGAWDILENYLTNERNIFRFKDSPAYYFLSLGSLPELDLI